MPGMEGIKIGVCRLVHIMETEKKWVKGLQYEAKRALIRR